MKKVSQKVLLTGASSGIGEAILKRLTAQGFEVIATVRKEEDSARLRKISDKIETVILDVLDYKAIDTLFERLHSEGVKLCGIINNAGIVVPGIVEYPDIDLIRHQFEINTLAPLKIATTFVQLMDEGKIINISSVASNFTFPFIAPYCVSKKALDIFFQGYANEVENKKIRVVSIKPGVIKTPLWDKSVKMAKENFDKLCPEAREKYASKFDKLLDYVEKSIQNGLDADVVARKVVSVLKSKHPKMSYTIGFEAHIESFLGKLSADFQHKLVKMRF